MAIKVATSARLVNTEELAGSLYEARQAVAVESDGIVKVLDIDLDHDPDELVALQGVRFFAGYSSWAPGQLDAELVDDAWLVVDAIDTDVLTSEPEELWWTVLRRQRSELRHLANYPTEPWNN